MKTLFRHTWPWLALITALGAVLRFWRIAEIPPALSGDEILVTLLARDSVARGNFPVYFGASFGGFHPAIVYLTMLARALTANHLLAVRFGVAAAGTLSVPLVFLAVREIFSLDAAPARNPDIPALLGALAFAIAFPDVLIQRLGFEVMLPAPLGALVFYCLARAMRTGARRWFVWSGAALGAALYTYYSARLLPVAVTLGVIWVILTQPPVQRRGLWLGFVLLAGVSLIVFSPLGLYFVRHPGYFLARSLTTGGDTLNRPLAELPLTLLGNTLRILEGLSAPGAGDVIPRHNIPGRPALDGALSLFFWLGLASAAVAWRRRSSALLISWFAAMLFPAILSLTGNSPHFTRLQGAMPPLAALTGLGGATVFHKLRKYRAWSGYGALVIGFTLSLGTTAYDYFVRWPQEPGVQIDFQAGAWQAARIARAATEAGLVYLSPDLISDYSRAAFNLHLFGNPRAREFPGPGCLIYRDRPAQPARYVVDVLLDHGTMERLEALFPAGRRRQVILSNEAGAWPLYAMFEVPPGAAARPSLHPTSVSLGEAVQLLGYDLNPTPAHPGDTLTITLYWKPLAPISATYSAFVHLHAPGEPQPAAQSDTEPCNGAFPSRRWSPGEIVLDTPTLTVPPDFAADHAEIALGLYEWPSQQRLPVSDGSPDRRLRLPDLSIAQP